MIILGLFLLTDFGKQRFDIIRDISKALPKKRGQKPSKLSFNQIRLRRLQ